VRDFFADLTIDYRLVITGSVEGQNSNTYITTLAHITGLDIGSAVEGFLASSSFGSFPGLARNVLFDHIDADKQPTRAGAADARGNGRIRFHRRWQRCRYVA
jgi:hypothetical protein